jgi:hypothetical protein
MPEEPQPPTRKPLVRPQHLLTAAVQPPPVPVKPAPPATNARKLQLPPLAMPPPQPHGLRRVQFQQPSAAMPPASKLPAAAPMACPPCLRRADAAAAAAAVASQAAAPPLPPIPPPLPPPLPPNPSAPPAGLAPEHHFQQADPSEECVCGSAGAFLLYSISQQLSARAKQNLSVLIHAGALRQQRTCSRSTCPSRSC